MSYCAACFNILDPDDTQSELRALIECTMCGRAYHAAHYPGVCECGANETRILDRAAAGRAAVAVSAAPPVIASFPTQAALIPPPPRPAARPEGLVRSANSGVIDTRKPQEDPAAPPPPRRTREWIVFGVSWMRSLLIGLLFVGLATLVGAFVPQAMQVRTVTLENILNAVTRGGLPAPVFILGAFTAAAALALVFYHRTFPYAPASWLWRVLAAVVAIGLCIAIANQLTLVIIRQKGLDLTLRSLEPPLFLSMGAAAVVVIALALLHRQIADMNEPPQMLKPTLPVRMGSLFRFAVVSGLLIFGAFVFAHYNMAGWSRIGLNDSIQYWRMLFGETQLLGSLAIGLAAAAIVYWPPARSHARGRSLGLRVAIVILAVGAFLFVYATTRGSTAAMLEAAALTIAAVVLFVPFQRVYS
jgi:MFS family permease